MIQFHFSCCVINKKHFLWIFVLNFKAATVVTYSVSPRSLRSVERSVMEASR